LIFHHGLDAHGRVAIARHLKQKRKHFHKTHPILRQCRVVSSHVSGKRRGGAPTYG
jgi:hypothetical protein